MKRGGRSLLAWIYGGVIAGHLAFAAVTALLPTPERSQAVAIELAEIKKKKDPPKPPPPPPPPPPKEEKPKPPPPRPASQSQAKIAAEPAKVDALPPSVEMGADGFADLGGVSLGGGGGEGIPVGPAAAAAAEAPKARAPKAVARRVEQLTATAQGGCSEPVVKPKAKKPGQIKYTMEARVAEIEGVVRVEVTVDETGRVISARVLSGLGYGLDDIARAAALATVFDPATLCGKPLVGTKILPFRFELR